MEVENIPEYLIQNYCNSIGIYELFQINELEMEEEIFRKNFIKAICLNLNAIVIKDYEEISDDGFEAKIKVRDICYSIECVFINTLPELEIEVYTKISNN